MKNNNSSNQNRTSLLIGFSSAGIASLLPRLHQIPVGRKSAIFVPASCGLFAWMSWQKLITNQLASKKLQCNPCACIRGATITVWSGCILPSLILVFIGLHRRNLFRVNSRSTLQSFFGEFTKPYNADKPYILFLWAFQGVLGFGASSWEFRQAYLKEPPYWNAHVTVFWGDLVWWVSIGVVLTWRGVRLSMVGEIYLSSKPKAIELKYDSGFPVVTY